MPSPFPGMDPYIEDASVWTIFHHHLLASLYQLMLPGLVDRYRARFGVRAYMTEMPLFTSITQEKHEEEFIEIRSRSDARLVTMIDVVSPLNRTTAAGRAAYLATRKEAVDLQAAVVEIDLVTQGDPALDFTRDGLPDYDHAVTVTRGETPERYEIYTTTVQKRLPKFKMPLAAEDRDTVVDLQVCVTRAYDHADLETVLDYSRALPRDVQLSEANRDWIEARLVEEKRR